MRAREGWREGEREREIKNLEKATQLCEKLETCYHTNISTAVA